MASDGKITLQPGWLVYRMGTRGLEPSKCHDLPIDNVHNRPREYVVKHALTAEQMLEPLKVLEAVFPAPQ